MGFTFDKKPTIEIDGRLYVCDPTDVGLIEGILENYPKIIRLGADFERIKSELVKASKDPDKAEEKNKEFLEKHKELLMECRAFIHGTLGVEEYNEIFAGRKPNSVEHLKLCVFIFNSIMQDRAKVLEEYLDVPQGDNDASDNAAG